MADYLEYDLDKFTFRVATDRYYNRDGVWAKEEDGRVIVGLSDFLQQRSGDIAFADIMKPGTLLNLGDEFANIETIKVDISLPAPVAGVIVEVNPAMEMEPEIINVDPYNQGWLVVIEATRWSPERAGLLNPEAYFDLMVAEAEEEAKSE